ncbi:transposase [Sporolactobacillus sp. STCC-11]|uniref:IS4 family transposase n=1 Tax=Sporolactobacillus caesalpiniae TaxID=3230362 RepID=UPI003395AE74
MKSIPRHDHLSAGILDSVLTFFSRFHLAQIARASHATKTKGVPFRVLFCYLLSTIFSNKSTYRDYLKHRNQLSFSDKTFRNLLNSGKINWQKFLILLCRQLIRFIEPLTDSARQNVFIIDDSMYERAHAKRVELAAFQFDHAKHRHTRGFRFLQLGWSDGNTFLPVSFSLLSGENQVCDTKVDARTRSGKRKLQAQRKGTDVARELIASALNQGVRAPYVLFDSWFSSPMMFHQLRQLKLHTVAMVKRSKKAYYRFNGQMMDVKAIFKAQKKRRGRSRYLLSTIVEVVVEGGEPFPLKLVYVRNRRKRKEYLVLASTNTQLSEDEIIQLYGKRWSIEVYFKMCKHYLRLAKYQGLSYDGIFAHTACVAIGYSLLAVQHREQEDDRTLGELFYLMVDELADITFTEAIRQLIDLFQEAFENELVLSEKVLDQIIARFLDKLPSNYQKQLKKVVD